MPEAATDPFIDLIGGLEGAPAYQKRASGALEPVPRATLEQPAGLDFGDFSDLVPQDSMRPSGDVQDFGSLSNNPAATSPFGDFHDLASDSGTSLSEQALYTPDRPQGWRGTAQGILDDAMKLPAKATIAAGRLLQYPTEAGLAGIAGKPQPSLRSVWPTDEEVSKPLVTPEQVQAGLQLPDAPPDTTSTTGIKGAARGLRETGNEFISGMSSPENLAILATGGLGRTGVKLIAGAFLGQQLLGTPEQWDALQKAPNIYEKTKIGSAMVGGLLLPTLGLLHGKARVRPGADVPTPTDVPTAPSDLPVPPAPTGPTSPAETARFRPEPSGIREPSMVEEPLPHAPPLDRPVTGKGRAAPRIMEEPPANPRTQAEVEARQQWERQQEADRVNQTPEQEVEMIRTMAEDIYDHSFLNARGPGPRSLAIEGDIVRRKQAAQYLTNDPRVLKAFDEAHRLASEKAEGDLGMNVNPDRPQRWQGNQEAMPPATGSYVSPREPRPQAPTTEAAPAPVEPKSGEPVSPQSPDRAAPAPSAKSAEAPPPVSPETAPARHSFPAWRGRERAGPEVPSEPKPTTAEPPPPPRAEPPPVPQPPPVLPNGTEHMTIDPEVAALTKPVTPVAETGAKLKLRANKEGGFVNPEILTEIGKFGRQLYRDGMEFGRWAADMVRHLGDQIRPHLQGIWDSITGRNFLPNARESGSIINPFERGKTEQRNEAKWVQPEEGESYHETDDGRFTITPQYNGRVRPQGWTLADKESGAKREIFSVADGKKLAKQWRDSPPPTPEQARATDIEHNYSRRSLAKMKAQKYGMEVRDNPDGTFSIVPKGESPPARIVGAAIMDQATGKIYTGSSHPEIWDKLPDTVVERAREKAYRGYAEDEMPRTYGPDEGGEGFNSPEGFIDGFVDENGKFLDREDALTQAVKAKQYKQHGKYDDKLELNELERQQREKANETQAKSNAGAGLSERGAREEATARPSETAAQADKLKLRANKEGGFVSPDILNDVADFGKKLYRKGVEFKDWSVEMIRHLGEKVRPHLKALWDSITGRNILPGARESGAILNPFRKKKAPIGISDPLIIDPVYKRLFKGIERNGVADILGNTKNNIGKLLGRQTTRHVDLEQELHGRFATVMEKAAKGLKGKKLDQALNETEGYFAARENGRPTPTISPAATKLINAWEKVAEESGLIAKANGVKVFDPSTNKYRPIHLIGKTYLPRMLKADVEAAMRDPTSNPTLWDKLVNDFSLQRGMSLADAAKELQKQSGEFSSTDYMGNLEKARAAKLPESFYEYNLKNIAARYIPQFSERMSQIIAYGQRLGPDGAPIQPNLWDLARKESGNPYTQRWLTEAENAAVNKRDHAAGTQWMSRAQVLGSGLQLSSPTTTVMRNVLTGVSGTAEIMGTRRSAKQLAKAAFSAQSKMDTREIGATRNNMGDFLHSDKLGDSWIDKVIHEVTKKALKWSTFDGSEVFVRTHAALTASEFAKDAAKSLNAMDALTTTKMTPSGSVTVTKGGFGARRITRQAKEALGLFKRMGVDAEKIVAENGDWKTGPETRKFIRTVIRDSQGGYRFDQVPLWANSSKGRFFYQYGRWGTQRARNIWKNGVKPALGETVQWHGKSMRRHDFRPLLKMAAGSVVLGEAFAGIAQGLFGRDRRDASVSEISQAWSEDKGKAVSLAMQRMVNDVIMSGTLGIWSQPLDWGKSLKDQSRLKNPTEPPGMASINALGNLVQAGLDQGLQVTSRDMTKFAGDLMPGLKQSYDVALNVFDEPLYEAQNDLKTLRGAARRWGEGAGLDVSPRVKGDFKKSVFAPAYEPIKDALLIGDAKKAMVLADEFIRTQPDKEKAFSNLKNSVRQSQPFRVGPYTSEEYRDQFGQWAKKNLSKEDYQQTERVQERYMRAAFEAGF